MGGLKRNARALFASAAIAFAAAGCASTPDGPVHVVRRGENLYRISQHYDVSVESLRRVNDIDDVTSLQIGQRLIIPGTSAQASTRSLAAARPSKSSSSRSSKRGVRRQTELNFVWPIDGKLSSSFGRRRGRSHDGIDIPAKRGTPVRAAEAGRVIHSGGGLGDYGKVVIVKHAGRYSTVYAHNRRNKVRKGEFVERGQVIAEVGSTGNASGPHVHFEVRRDKRPEDPLLHLP